MSGKLSAADLKKMIKKGHGTAELKTVSGGILKAMERKDGHITLQDEKGGTATITIPDVYQSNGVIQVVDAVLLPN